MAGEGLEAVASGDIPEANRLIITCREECTRSVCEADSMNSTRNGDERGLNTRCGHSSVGA